MIKKLISALLAVFLLLSMGQAFALPSDWAQGEVAQAQSLGLVPTELQVRYQENITRLEFCRLAIQFLEVKTQMPVTEFMENRRLALPPAFVDCDELAVLQANALGITNGRGEGKFAPHASITREEAATMLHRLNQAILGEPLAISYGSFWGTFDDFYHISDWAREGITFVVQTTNPIGGLPVMQGTAAKRFSPKASYTIEQSILTMLRLYHGTQYRERGILIDTNGASSLSGDEYNNSNFGTHAAGGLFANGAGYDLVVLKRGAVTVFQLDRNLSPTGSRSIPMELARTVGVHQNEAGDYFLVFAQDNLSEAANQEVLRLVRYNADWQRQGAASVNGGSIITRQPVYAGNLQMADDGSHLTILTTRERFAYTDGIRHQSNLTLTFDMASLRLLYSSDAYPSNHVSHSFNQHLLYDGDALVTLDHGDAYPRALVLHRGSYNMASCKSYAVFNIAGGHGDNTTGVTQGGLAATTSHYVAAYNTIDQRRLDPYSERNAMLALLPRSNPQEVTTLPLTAFPISSGKTASAPQLVPLPDGRVAVLWEICVLKDHPSGYPDIRYVETQYTVLDSSGTNLGSVQSSNQRICSVLPATFLNGQLLAPNPYYDDENNRYYIGINTIDLSMFD